VWRNGAAMPKAVRLRLLLGAALLTPCLPARAQQVTSAPGKATPQAAAGQPAPQDDNDEIIVKGRPARGSVVGDIPAENILTSRDVKATGATNFEELLEALGPQLSTAQNPGDRPLVLLNGRRVSSYRELRDIPIEAVSRVDILPEEVALKYGYRADQKVVNIVLSKHFQSTTAQIAANTSSEHNFTGGSADVTRMQVDLDKRTTINGHIGGEDILGASERQVVGQDQDSPATGSSLPSSFRARVGATANRELGGDVEGSFNLSADHDVGHSLANVADQLPNKVDRSTVVDNGHLGAVLNQSNGPWQWNLVANGDLQHSETETESSLPRVAPNDGRYDYAAAGLDGTVNGNLFALPGGHASATLRAAVSAAGLDVHQSGEGLLHAPDSTDRTTGTLGASIDLPISHRSQGFKALGNMTLNGNAEVDRTSDFGTLTTLGAGLNWSPLPLLNLIGSWSRVEDAPGIHQLGDPIVQTPEVSLFDFVNGSMLDTNVITGGNEALQSPTRQTFKVSGTFQPLDSIDLKLRAEYSHLEIDDPIVPLTTSPALQTAFPARFIRDPAGDLINADLRPVNLHSERRDAIRAGFDFTRSLQSRSVTASQVEKVVQSVQAKGINVASPAVPSGSGSLADIYKAHGRLTFSFTDTITLVDRAVVAPGGPQLDYLHGEPIGQTGGQPRHEIQAQAGWFNNGVGARFGFDWRSATDVDTIDAGRLHFSPFGTFDLRLFANVGQDLAIVAKHPFLAGSSIRFEAGNILNNRPRVHDEAGNVPIGYDPDQLDPLGRTLLISFRKQFLPSSYYREQLQKFEQRLQGQ
jgi:hypothetical protein